MTNIEPAGGFEVGERGVGPFGSGRGVNVLIMRASDLHVVFERTWDVSGGRKPAEARAASEALRAAFAPKEKNAKNAAVDDDENDENDDDDARTPDRERRPSARDRGELRPGELAPGSATRREWGAHFVAVTTAGAWAMAAGKDGDDHGVGAAMDAVASALGCSPSQRADVRAAAKGFDKAPGQPAGVAMLAACDPSGAISTVWCVAGRGPKDRACVSLTLGCAGGEWFPAFTGGIVSSGSGAGGDGETTDARTPWSVWGEEPWHLAPVGHAADKVGKSDKVGTSPLEAIAARRRRAPANFADEETVAAFAAESVRVSRYRTIVADAKAEMIAGARAVGKEWDASGGGGGGGGGAGGWEGRSRRV